jgi:hypothetical protein
VVNSTVVDVTYVVVNWSSIGNSGLLGGDWSLEVNILVGNSAQIVITLVDYYIIVNLAVGGPSSLSSIPVRSSGLPVSILSVLDYYWSSGGLVVDDSRIQRLFVSVVEVVGFDSLSSTHTLAAEDAGGESGKGSESKTGPQ